MFRCRPVAVGVFALWTLLVWGNRIYLIVAQDGGDGVDLARAIAFVAVGLAVAVTVAVPLAPERAHRVVTVAAGASIALWATRIVTIPLNDHPVGFVVVHLVLAAISIALAVWAVRSSRASLGADPTDRSVGGPDQTAPSGVPTGTRP